MTSELMCIEYLGTLGSTVNAPHLKNALAMGEDGVPSAAPRGPIVASGERRLVSENVGMQLVEQANYAARSFALATLSGDAIADGKSKLQVYIYARETTGQAKVNVAATETAPARVVEIILAASGSARIASATPTERKGVFVATLTAPKEPGVVTVTGTVDGEAIITAVAFAPKPEGEPASK